MRGYSQISFWNPAGMILIIFFIYSSPNSGKRFLYLASNILNDRISVSMGLADVGMGPM